MTGDADERPIRVVAVGVVRREGADGDELLVQRERDAAGEPFYRPPGGGVEFGEPSAEALRREFREEVGVELAAVSYLDTYEDVFTHEGRTHHELWRCYEAEIAEDWPYERDSFAGYEPELDERLDCVWKPIAELGPEDGEGETFYPGGILSEL